MTQYTNEHANNFIYLIFFITNKRCIIMNKDFMRMMGNPPHDYKNLIKT